MGNFNQTIAILQLGGSETAIVVSIVICSILLLLSVVGTELGRGWGDGGREDWSAQCHRWTLGCILCAS